MTDILLWCIVDAACLCDGRSTLSHVVDKCQLQKSACKSVWRILMQSTGFARQAYVRRLPCYLIRHRSDTDCELSLALRDPAPCSSMAGTLFSLILSPSIYLYVSRQTFAAANGCSNRLPHGVAYQQIAYVQTAIVRNIFSSAGAVFSIYLCGCH